MSGDCWCSAFARLSRSSADGTDTLVMTNAAMAATTGRYRMTRSLYKSAKRRLRQADQVREHPVSSRDASRKLPEPRIRCIHIVALSDPRVHLASALRRLARVRRLEQRNVPLVERRERVQITFLDPAVEVRIRDAVGKRKERMVGSEDSDRCRLVRYPRGHLGWKRSEAAPDIVVLLVLHDERASSLDVLQQPTIVGHELRPCLGRPNADDDRVERREVAGRKPLLVDERRVHAHSTKRLVHLVPA